MVVALIAANTINAGADIGAVAAAINMLVPIPIVAMIVPVTASILALQLWGSYRLIERTFKWLTLALFAYIVTAVFVHPGWSEVLTGTFIPAFSFDRKFLAILTAVLGTTVSPMMDVTSYRAAIKLRNTFSGSGPTTECVKTLLNRMRNNVNELCSSVFRPRRSVDGFHSRRHS